MKREMLASLPKEALVDFAWDAYSRSPLLKNRLDVMLLSQTNDVDKTFNLIKKQIQEVEKDRRFFRYNEISYQEDRLGGLLASIETGLVAASPSKAAQALCDFFETHENVHALTDDECCFIADIYNQAIDMLLEVMPRLSEKAASSVKKKLAAWKESDNYGVLLERDFSDLLE